MSQHRNHVIYFVSFQIFANEEITYAGQAYGMIVAKSRSIAELAASRVKLVYPDGPRRKPMITVHDVIASNDKNRIVKMFEMPAQQPPGITFTLLLTINLGKSKITQSYFTDRYLTFTGKNAKHKIKGNYECGPQYHFHMETQSCVCVPLEDGMDVFTSTQYMDFVQGNIASVLDVKINRYEYKMINEIDRS